MTFLVTILAKNVMTFFAHRPTTDYRHHSHHLCLSSWSFVRCSYKFIRKNA